MTQKIICPNCRVQISIDDVLTHQIEDNLRTSLERDFKEKKQALLDQQSKLTAAREDLKQIVAKRVEDNLKLERQKIKTDLMEEISKEKADEFRLMTEQLAEKERKLDESRKAELELRKDKLALEEAKKSFEVEKQRQLDAERQQIMETAAKKAGEEQQFKVMELSKQLSDAMKVNEELSRKLQQGSQQTQGEVLELELEVLLQREFPFDEITPVGKGINGADIIQVVRDKFGRQCGTIVWESKRTKNWTEGWIQKLKDDQLREKADIAVIVTATLPKDYHSFGLKEGVWVTDFESVVGLAMALRMNILQISGIKLASVGKNEKMEVLYAYLTGNEFKQKIEAIVSTFTALQQDLDQEKRAYARIWEKREKQIGRVIENTIGMYGDLEGLTGQALPKIDLLELPSETVE